MKQLLEFSNVELLPYNPDDDPTKITQLMLTNHRLSLGTGGEDDFEPIEWTLQESWVRDKDLAERVKNRKVIRNKKRSSTADSSDSSLERKKIKTDIDNNTQLDVTVPTDLQGDGKCKIESETKGGSLFKEMFCSDVKQEPKVKSEIKVEGKIEEQHVEEAKKPSVALKEEDFSNEIQKQKEEVSSEVWGEDKIENGSDNKSVFNKEVREVEELINKEINSRNRDAVVENSKEMIEEEPSVVREGGKVCNVLGNTKEGCGSGQMKRIIICDVKSALNDDPQSLLQKVSETIDMIEEPERLVVSSPVV